MLKALFQPFGHCPKRVVVDVIDKSLRTNRTNSNNKKLHRHNTIQPNLYRSTGQCLLFTKIFVRLFRFFYYFFLVIISLVCCFVLKLSALVNSFSFFFSLSFIRSFHRLSKGKWSLFADFLSQNLTRKKNSSNKTTRIKIKQSSHRVRCVRTICVFFSQISSFNGHA